MPTCKELRFNADGGVWRVAFAFDPERKGILLVAGDRRLASPNTVFMAHTVMGGYNEDEELYTAQAQIKATAMVWKMWAKCMEKHTNHTEKYWLKELGNTVRELWLTADQMKMPKHGIIDGIWGA